MNLGPGLIPRPSLARAAVGLSLAFTLAACGNVTAGPAPASSAQTVKLGTNPISPSNGFVWIGRDMGLYAKAGVGVEIQGLGGAQRMNSIVAGQIDGEAGAGPQQVVAAVAQGTDLTMVAAFSNRFDDVLLVPDGITSIEQLRGKTIGSVTTTSVDVQALTLYMRKFGMEIGRDYKLVGVGASASQAGAAAAIAAHQVDAGVMQQDFAQDVADRGGFHVLVDMYDTDLRQPGLPLDFRTEFVRQHPDLVQKTLDALIDSVRYAKQHPAETKALWSTQLKIDDPERMDQIYRREIQLWQSAPIPDVSAMPDVIDFVSQSNPAARSVDPAKLVDTRFVEDAIKRGLTSS
ncbi:MAG TPA: ABC transporter substrate-binding protein [Chloroflexota bacterium]|nr:ABC transporter substrate-binding protein [Chloroflexota bacterium]